ncbi:hypothetical protein EON65_39980 [archaeon]|nr:MAG: hypothetical protein EON65_39980 [archaeon]
MCSILQRKILSAQSNPSYSARIEGLSSPIPNTIKKSTISPHNKENIGSKMLGGLNRCIPMGGVRKLYRNQKITTTPIPFRSPPKVPKLYYSPTSCGAASFIAAHSAGLQMDCEEVNLKTHRTASGEDFHRVNPKGNVPTIVFEHGSCKVVLNENIATLQYIADQVI